MRSAAIPTAADVDATFDEIAARLQAVGIKVKVDHGTWLNRALCGGPVSLTATVDFRGSAWRTLYAEHNRVTRTRGFTDFYVYEPGADMMREQAVTTAEFKDVCTRFEALAFLPVRKPHRKDS